MRKGWFKAFKKEPTPATRLPDRSVVYWEARSAA
jgi:hypothetical protein